MKKKKIAKKINKKRKIVRKSKNKNPKKKIAKKIKKKVKKIIRNKKMEERKLSGGVSFSEKLAFAFLLLLSLVFALSLLTIERMPKKELVEKPIMANPLEIRINDLVSNHPIQEMVPYIVNQKSEVARYLVAIAKKESNWGKISPQKDGKTCYNYWGYRGTYNQTKSGYSCFRTPQQAVRVVGGRIEKLIEQGLDTPDKMVVWKCGRTCAGHGSSAQKWIDDVGLYYQKL